MTETETLFDARHTPVGSTACDTSRQVSEQADLLLDGVTVALQDFDTETLRSIADYRDVINPDCWIPKLIREYLSVWRQG